MVNSYLESALIAAFKAGEAIMEVYHSYGMKVDYKEDDSPVTIADKNASGIIVNELSRFGIPIISEEEEIADYDVRRGWASCWMVDPLDGTKEFIRREKDFTVNIALIRQKEPVLGIIYAPVTRKMYFGGVGLGAFRMDVEKMSELKRWQDATRLPDFNSGRKYGIVGSKSHMNSETEEAIEAIYRERGRDNCEKIIVGSSLKFCIMAEGKASLYPRYSNIMEWDIAAGHAIAVASGCEMTEMDGTTPVLYNKRDLHAPFFIVKRK
jgi:3'(2'), 5'-bisphosphate nucleotidase